jgi:hypothetical protein
MTATIVPLFSQPIDTAEAVRDARKVVFSPIKVDDRDLRTACQVLISMGDGDDYMIAQVALLMLDRGDLQRDGGKMLACYVLAAVVGTLSAILALVLL